jgi:hypothetical protein
LLPLHLGIHSVRHALADTPIHPPATGRHDEPVRVIKTEKVTRFVGQPETIGARMIAYYRVHAEVRCIVG